MVLSIRDFPLVYACYNMDFREIINTGSILSKKELRSRGKPPEQKVGHMLLEETLGTDDDVTLYLDREFKGGNYYGGEIGPRLVFNPKVIFLEGAFILPQDQAGYHEEDYSKEYSPFSLGIKISCRKSEFEKDKISSDNEKTRFLLSYKDGKIKSLPEVHIPHELSLSFLEAILMPFDRVEASFLNRLPHVNFLDVPYTGHDPLRWKKSFESLWKMQ